jgi:Leucine-rich repeat (LRR) protein
MDQNKNTTGCGLVSVMVVLGCGLLLMFLVFMAVRQARDAARRMHCTNNLKGMGMGIHNFHDTQRGLPPLLLGPERASVFTLILPYCRFRQQPPSFAKGTNFGDPMVDNWKKLDRSQQAAFGSVDFFHCPSRREGILLSASNDMPGPVLDYGVVMMTKSAQPSDWVNYIDPCNDQQVDQITSALRVANVDGCPTPNYGRARMRDTFMRLSDGISNIIIVGEKHLRPGEFGRCCGDTYGKGADGSGLFAGANQRQYSIARSAHYPLTQNPTDFDGRDGRPDGGPLNDFGFGSDHADVVLFLAGDGSVRHVSKTIDARLLRQVADIADGISFDEDGRRLTLERESFTPHTVTPPTVTHSQKPDFPDSNTLPPKSYKGNEEQADDIALNPVLRKIREAAVRNSNSLDLRSNSLTTLPPEIGKLTKLKVLNLQGNQLTTLPPEIGNLTNLRELWVDDNQLTTLPPEFGNLTNLDFLSLHFNRLETVPPELWELTNLRTLWIGANQFTVVPPEIGKLTNLKSLALRDSKLTTLPPEIGNLTNLEDLYFFNSQITTLPPEFGKLTKLKRLWLHNNQLTKLPLEMENLVNLEMLNLNSNRISATEIERLKMALPNCKIHNAPGNDKQPEFLLSGNLVKAGSVWKYLDNNAALTDQWIESDFDDSDWKEGPAELGYGDGDEKTVISYGPYLKIKYITTYFRHEFQVANVADIENMVLGLVRDDGAAVCLNGSEIVRDNLELFASAKTFATAPVSRSSETEVHYFTVDPGLLVKGVNTLAVEVHQADLTSTDLSFDLQLSTNVRATLEEALLAQDLSDRYHAARLLRKFDPEATLELIAELDEAITNAKTPDAASLLRSLRESVANDHDLLRLFEKRITILPPEIGKMVHLRKLMLYNNRIKTIPPEIGKLKHLEWLWLGGNRLTSLPPEFGNLTNLTHLWIGRNPFTKLPPELANLKTLQVLSLEGTGISAAEIERLKKALPNCEINHD